MKAVLSNSSRGRFYRQVRPQPPRRANALISGQLIALTAIASAGVVAPAVRAGDPPRYMVSLLIDDNGVRPGGVDLSEGTHEILFNAGRSLIVWSDGEYMSSKLPENVTLFFSSAINERGEIAGTAEIIDPKNGNPTIRAAIWREGEVIDITSALNEEFGGAVDINASGEAVAFGFSIDQTRRAFRWRDGVRTELPELRDVVVAPEAINALGQVIGVVSFIPNSFNDVSAVLIEPNSNEIQELARLEGESSYAFAYAIDEQGAIIVGEADGDPGVVQRSAAVAWIVKKGSEPRVARLPSFNGEFASRALDVNSAGNVVGSYHEPNGLRPQAALWIQAGGGNPQAFNLNDLMTDSYGRSVDLQSALAINESGWILGRAMDEWRPTSFLATPVHLELDPPTPGIAGRVNSLTVRGAGAGARIAFVYSDARGLTPVPGREGLVVGLASPRLIAVGRADANGDATIESFVPQGARGRVLHLQAIDLDTELISQVALTEFD